MEKMITVAQLILPIFCCVFLGAFSKRKKLFTPDDIQAFQRLVVKFCFPCLLFKSSLTAQLGMESLSGLVLPLLLVIPAIWGFRVGRKKFPYHNIPFVFCCKETGMLGIPLFMILFGADQAYRVGLLDVTQAIVVFPVISILSADTDGAASPLAVVKEMFKSPLILMSLLGLTMNLSGIWNWMQLAGVDGIVLDIVNYISQPVSVIMLFCVGYNLSLQGEYRSETFRIAAVHMGIFLVVELFLQLSLLLFPNVDPMTRWAYVLYLFLPTSFMVPSLGRKEKDAIVASNICSVLTVMTLLAFCVMAVIVA